jgi:hypothetical protein
MSTPLSSASVSALAEAAGIPLADDAMAERIAAGASAAIAAVRAQLGESLCEYEPGDYLAALERLSR